MKYVSPNLICAVVLACGILIAGPAVADKPAWAGKGGKEQRTEQKGEHRAEGGKSQQRGEGHASAKGGHFEDRQQGLVRDYYAAQFREGRCPPGLAKKRNGCMPPGQAKKWQLGRQLPAGVIYHDVPQPLLVQIGSPPSGYRYVRVSSDILMMALGTGMIVDAIRNLGR